MHKVSYMLAKRLSQDPLETYICEHHPAGAWKDKLPLYDFDYTNTFRKQKLFILIATGKARDENLESDRTSSISAKKHTKQFLLSSKVSGGHQIGTKPSKQHSK